MSNLLKVNFFYVIITLGDLYDGRSETKSAGLLSVLLARQSCRWIFVRASKQTGRSLSPLPNTMHSRSAKFISSRFSAVISPILIPEEASRSIIARSRVVSHPSRSSSSSSSEQISLMVFGVLTLWILRTGLFIMQSSSSSHEKKLERMRRILSMVTLLDRRLV